MRAVSQFGLHLVMTHHQVSFGRQCRHAYELRSRRPRRCARSRSSGCT